MIIACTNKGCMKTSEALLNTETNEVICQECQKPIENITEIMKKTLKSIGQIIRNNAKKAFMVFCSKCKANREVVLKGKETVCKVCQSQIKISTAFRTAMEESGVKLEKIED